jgi:hypothetical protein
MTDIVDKKLWRQCNNLLAGVKKPWVLPNRIGAMMGLEKEEPGEENDEVTVVSLVDGNFVKMRHDMNFAETTHEEKNPDYCDGIWIDANLPPREWPFLLYRSAHEYRDMCQDMLSSELATSRSQKGERELRLSDFHSQGKSLK